MTTIQRFRDRYKVRYILLGVHRAEVCKTRGDAITKRAEVDAALAKGLDPRTKMPIYVGSGIGTEDALKEFREWSVQQGRAPRTLERDCNTLVAFLAECPEFVSQIAKEHITEFMVTRSSSASNYNNSVNALRAFWKFMLDAEYVNEDLTVALKRRRIPRHIPEIFTPKEIISLIEAMPEAYRPFTKFLAVTGCRVSEAINLHWKDVELPKVVVRSPKERHDKVLILPPLLCQELNALKRKCEYVFTGCLGRRINLRSAEDVMERAGVRAGLPADKCHWHNLRHTAASNLVLTLPVPIVQRILGHSVITTTERYLHIADVHMAEAAAGALQDYAEQFMGQDLGQNAEKNDAESRNIPSATDKE